MMKVMLCLLVLGSVLVSCVTSSKVPVWKEEWFKQLLDHFNPRSAEVFSQRYLTYSAHWDPNNDYGGPIFVYTGNEGNIESFWNNTGFVFDIAPRFGAAVIFIEHRYYGQSLPFGVDSFTNDNLRYLTVENTIADFANIVSNIALQYNDESIAIKSYPKVAFGGSYGGILSALMRIHYPSLINMALAASAPWPQLLNAATDDSVFWQITTDDFTAIDVKCPQIVRNGFVQLLALFESNATAQISDIFHLCSEPHNLDSFEQLQLWIKNAFSSLATVDYPYRSDMFGSLPGWPVTVACQQLLIPSQNDALTALSKVTSFYYRNASVCYNISKLYPHCSDHAWCGMDNDAKAWNYQLCTQIIISMVTNNITDMFPPSVWTADNMTEYCGHKYGSKLDYDFMRVYFPFNVSQAGSRIIWSNGLLDPWHGGGFYTKPVSDTMPIVVIDNAAHHYDLRGSHPNDTQSVIDARNKEIQLLHQWLLSI